MGLMEKIMPHLKDIDDIEREAKYKAQQLGHKLEKAKRGVVREAEDFLKPPSTITQVERFFEDACKDDIKPAAAKLNVNIKREMSQLGKDISELLHSNKSTSAIATGFSDLSKKISNNPVMKALGDFCSKMGNLVSSLAGTDKDRAKAWENLKKATVKVGTTIKKAVGVEKSSGFAR
jgi:septation ring formation regulator EzrA